MTQIPPEDQNTGGEQPNGQQPGGFPPPNQPPSAPPPPSYGSSSQPPSYGSPQQPYGQQPPGGGTPPPPPPGGGTPPPPPPGGGFPAAPPPPAGQYGQYGAPQYGGPAGPGGPGGPWGGASQFSVGNAISYGWNAFKSNAGVWIGAFLAVGVISVLLQSLLNPAVDVDLGGTSGGIPVVQYTVGGQLLAGIASIVTYLLSAVLIQGAVHKVNGRFEGFGSFTNFTHAGPLFVAAAAMGVVSLVLGMLSIVSPVLTSLLNLVWAVLSVFVLYIAADRGLQVIDAIKESIQLVTSNLGSVIVLWLATIGLVIAGIIVICFTGLIVVVPLLVIAWAFAYKTLSGQPVAAP